MDDALALQILVVSFACVAVLILVVMDDALALGRGTHHVQGKRS